MSTNLLPDPQQWLTQRQQTGTPTAPPDPQEWLNNRNQQTQAQSQAPGFWGSLYNSTVGNLVNGVSEYLNRPSEIKKTSDALGVYDKIYSDSASLPENKGKPQSQWKLRNPTPDERQIIDAGMSANLQPAEGNILQETTAPAVQAAKQVSHGNVGGGVGTVLGAYGVPAALGAATALAPETFDIHIPIRSSLDASEQAAVDFARQNNIPLDPATATGNAAIQNLQKLSQNMPGVAGYARNNYLAQKNAMVTVGQNVAEKATGTNLGATPESAGLSVQGELARGITTNANDARAAYGRLQAIESDPANAQTIQTGTKQQVNRSPNGSIIGAQTTPVVEKMGLPVDMRPVKQGLQDLYDDLKQQMPIAQQRASYGLKAIENIMAGTDYMPASVADQNLSAMKAIQREAVNPKTKYVAGQAVDQYSTAVDAAVARGGPTATQALQDGRELWKAKIALEDTANALPSEPVQLFNRLTSAKDANIQTLRDVAEKAPNALPAVGRAYLDGLMDKAFAEAGTDKPGTVLTQWQNLGPNTKQTLFADPGMRSDLDNFFTLAKKRAENPNPSGTASTAMWLADGTMLISKPGLAIPYFIGRTALGRILTSPGGAKLLTEGLSIPAHAGGKAAFTANQILNIAGADAKPVNQAQYSGTQPAPQPQQ